MSADIPNLSGWVLVPKVATMDMVSAVWGSSASDVWSLMLSKAPSPPIDVSAMLAERDALGLQLDEAQKSLQEIIATLSDPPAVRVLVLRGFIKVPADLVFLYDSDGPVAEKVREARRSALEEAAQVVEELPRCVEPLGGQSYSYVRLEEASAAIRALIAPAPEVLASLKEAIAKAEGE